MIEPLNNPSTSSQTTDDTESIAEALYEFTKELSREKYESELRREDSLIHQSSQMQTVFSFMTAAIFMALPTMINYRGNLTLNFFFVAISTIIIALLASLFSASLAQRRIKKQAFMDIPDIERFVEDNWKLSQSKSQQYKQWVKLLGEVQLSITKANDSRVLNIRISMYCFYCAIAFIILWYIVALAKLL